MKKTATDARTMAEGWHRVSVGRIYHWNGRLAKVTGKFRTTEGTYVHLRDPETDESLGNAPWSDLGEKVEGRI